MTQTVRPRGKTAFICPGQQTQLSSKSFSAGETFPDVKYVNCQIQLSVCVALNAKTHTSQRHPETYKEHLDVTQKPQTEVVCWQTDSLYRVYMLSRDVMKSWGNVFYYFNPTSDVMWRVGEGQVVIVVGWEERCSSGRHYWERGKKVIWFSTSDGHTQWSVCSGECILVNPSWTITLPIKPTCGKSPTILHAAATILHSKNWSLDFHFYGP